jgi:hypothetical protein
MPDARRYSGVIMTSSSFDLRTGSNDRPGRKHFNGGWWRHNGVPAHDRKGLWDRHIQRAGRFRRVSRVASRLRRGLVQGDDWSFIIKLSALIDAALTWALAARFNADPVLEDHLARLNVGGPTGKLELAKDAGLIDKQIAKFIDKLQQLRNKNALDIRNKVRAGLKP